LLDMTAAYAGIANGRWPVRPRGVPQDADAKAWYDLPGLARGRMGSRETAAMRDLLGAAITDGTGRAARLSVPAFGKTGTTQDHRDAMFIGFAGDLVVGVWVGNDDNSPMKGMTGGGVPARIWRDFMASALRVSAGAAPRNAEPRRVDLPGGGPAVIVEGGEIILPEEIEAIERSAAEIEGIARRLGGEQGGFEDLATVAREGRRIYEDVGAEFEEVGADPPPEE